MNLHSRSLWKSYALYAFCLIAPSIATTHKYGGASGLIAYLLGAIVFIPLALHFGLTKLVRRLAPKSAWLLAGLCFLGLIAAFAVMYPYAQGHTTGGGSDADDALNLAARELLHGRYPYYPRTYLNFPISAMPGAVLLAVPFHLIGNAAYQNVFWLIVFFFLSLWTLRDVRLTLLHFLVVLIFAPAVIHHYVIGSDLIANSIYVMAFMQLLLHIHPKQRPFADALCAILFGVALSSRFNFVFLAPPVFAVLWYRYGRSRAFRQTLIAAVAFVSTTLPFYLYDPAGFAPLHAFSKLNYFDQFVPHTGRIVFALMAMTSFGLAFRRDTRDEIDLFRNCAYIQMVPVVACFLIEHARFDHLNDMFPYYGLFFTFFGSLAAFADLAKKYRGSLEMAGAVRLVQDRQ